MDVLSRTAVSTPVVSAPGTTRATAALAREWAPAGIVAASTVASALWVASQLLRRDDALSTPSYDQAFFQQLVWNIDHGRWFVSSFNQGSFLGVHFAPLLVVPAALELIWPDARVLDAINSVAVALVAPATFLLLRAALAPARAGVQVAAALGSALPFTPAMQEVARAGFHTETMAFPALLLAGWAGVSGRPALMWALAAIPLLAKEDQVYAVGAVGLLVAARGRGVMRRHGLLLVATTIAWGAALFLVIMPALRGGGMSDTHDYYAWLGPFPTQVLAPIREPSAVWNQLAHPDGWIASAGLVVSLGGLSALRPRWLLLVLPALAADLLSRHYPQPELHLQYALLIVAPALVATAMGARRALFLIERASLKVPPAAVRAGLAPALTALAVPGLMLGAVVGSLPPAGHASAAFARPAATARLESIASIIPANAPVAADDDVAAPLASRQVIYVLPKQCDRCYVVVDRAGQSAFMTAPQRDSLLAALPRDRRLLADDGRFQVWSPAVD